MKNNKYKIYFTGAMLLLLVLGIKVGCKKQEVLPELSFKVHNVSDALEVKAYNNNASVTTYMSKSETIVIDAKLFPSILVTCKSKDCVYTVNGISYVSTRIFNATDL